MNGPVEMEHLRKIKKIKRDSNKDLRLIKESLRTIVKTSDYCGQIRKSLYNYVSGIVRSAYKQFINEDIRDCFSDYEPANI